MRFYWIFIDVKLIFLCFCYWMDRWIKVECLALFAPKLGERGIETDVFEMNKVSDYSLYNVLKKYHEQRIDEGLYCIICDKYSRSELCDNCEPAIMRIIVNEPVFVYRMKCEYSKFDVVIPFYGETSDDELIAICGQNISTYTIESCYWNFGITQYFSKEMNYLGACWKCRSWAKGHFCDYHLMIYDGFVDKLYQIYLVLRRRLIADVSRAMFLDIYLSYAILFDFR